jgi:F420-dependent oxidoreductase-like protein
MVQSGDQGAAMAFFGLYCPYFTFPGVSDDRLFARVAEIAAAAEDADFDALFVMDHFHMVPNHGPPTDAMPEAYTLLGALAARTSRIQLGALVTGVTYRNPALLAKMVTTLDLVSSGRAICGLGAGWYEAEHQAYGFPFPPVAERLDRLEEALRICRAMFTEDAPSIAGQYYQIAGALNFPRPIQPGGPPIWVGGGGERRTLRLAAQYADVCDLPLVDLVGVQHKLDVLTRHCESVGRDPATIRKMRQGPVMLVKSRAEAEARLEWAIAGMAQGYPGADLETMRRGIIAGDPASVVEQVGIYLEAGLDGMTLVLRGAHEPESISLIGEALRKAFGPRQSAA